MNKGLGRLVSVPIINTGQVFKSCPSPLYFKCLIIGGEYV